MSLDDLRTLGESGGVLLVLVVSAYSGWKARRADQQTRSTGNGFAKEVKDSLRRIEKKIDDHIDAHADADVARRRH